MKYTTFKIFVSIIIFSILDFFANIFFLDVLHAPLFFDTIFMMAALFIFGPAAAFLEYVIYISIVCVKLSLLYGKTDHVYFYALSALTIIFVTWLFSRRKENLQKGVNNTFLYLFTAAVVAGFACSVVSGVISYFTYNMNHKNWTFDHVIFAFKGEPFNILAIAILGRIPITILDRVITTFAGFGVYKLYLNFKNRGSN